jgi:hypothetical protein
MNCPEYCRFDGIEHGCSIILRQLTLGSLELYNCIGFMYMLASRRKGWGWTLWCDWDLQQSIVCALSFYEDFIILYYLHVVFGKDSDTIVVTELPDGDECATF